MPDIIPIPVLETPRLILRPPVMEDAAKLQPLFNDWEVVKHLNPNIPWPYPEDGTEQFFKSFLMPAIAAGEGHAWIITQKSDGVPMGLIEIRSPTSPDSRGFWLGRAFQGKGYMTEAVIAVTDFAFDVLQRPILYLNNAADNAGSHAIKVSQGARLVKIVEDKFVAGALPKEVWHLTPDDWRASRLKSGT